MKKSLFLAVCFIMSGIAASAITINKALLQHKGKVTLFDGDEMQAAIDAAADGDTIYMTLGAFNKPFTINKEITIRGVGEKTVVNGNVTVDIPDNPKLTSTLIEAVRVIGTFDVQSAVNDMVIRKCMIDNLTFSADVSGVVIDRCYITKSLTLSSCIKDITVNNSKIKSLLCNAGTTSQMTIVNCNIYSFNPTNFCGTIINSVIDYAGSSDYLSIGSSVLMNTLINTYHLKVLTTSVALDCYLDYYNYTNSNGRIVFESCALVYSDAQLKSKGYLGTDGTVVGINGGNTPFTLESSVPTVTSSELNLDLEQRKLNVKLTVSPK